MQVQTDKPDQTLPPAAKMSAPKGVTSRVQAKESEVQPSEFPEEAAPNKGAPTQAEIDATLGHGAKFFFPSAPLAAGMPYELEIVTAFCADQFGNEGLSLFALELWRNWPQASEEAGRAYREQKAQAAALRARVAELEQEVDELSSGWSETLDELRRANLPPDLRADARHILTLLEIDNGATVREIAEGIQLLSYDSKARPYDWKGKLRAMFKFENDPDDEERLIVSAEISPLPPATKLGGRLRRKTDGTISTDKDHAKAFQLKLSEPEKKDPVREALDANEAKAFRDLLASKGVTEFSVVGQDGNKRVVRIGKSKAA